MATSPRARNVALVGSCVPMPEIFLGVRAMACYVHDMNLSLLSQAVRTAGRIALPAAGTVVVAGALLQTLLLYKLGRSLHRYGDATASGDSLDWMA